MKQCDAHWESSAKDRNEREKEEMKEQKRTTIRNPETRFTFIEEQDWAGKRKKRSKEREKRNNHFKLCLCCHR